MKQSSISIKHKQVKFFYSWDRKHRKPIRNNRIKSGFSVGERQSESFVFDTEIFNVGYQFFAVL